MSDETPEVEFPTITLEMVHAQNEQIYAMLIELVEFKTEVEEAVKSFQSGGMLSVMKGLLGR